MGMFDRKVNSISIFRINYEKIENVILVFEDIMCLGERTVELE